MKKLVVSPVLQSQGLPSNLRPVSEAGGCLALGIFLKVFVEPRARCLLSGPNYSGSGQLFPGIIWGPKKHINFFNINFLARTQNTPLWAPSKKLMCLSSWERTQKRDPHKLFGGDLGVKRGVPNGPFSATKSLVYCFSCP